MIVDIHSLYQHQHRLQLHQHQPHDHPFSIKYTDDVKPIINKHSLYVIHFYFVDPELDLYYK